MDEPEPTTPDPDTTTDNPLTANTALANAARVLHAAEMETDRQLMTRLTEIADVWTTIGAIQSSREDNE